MVKPSIAVIVPDGSALEEITEQEVEMLVLEYWHHHQIVLSGDGQPDLKPQVRRVRVNTGQHGHGFQSAGVCVGHGACVGGGDGSDLYAGQVL